MGSGGQSQSDSESEFESRLKLERRELKPLSGRETESLTELPIELEEAEEELVPDLDLNPAKGFTSNSSVLGDDGAELAGDDEQDDERVEKSEL